ncbi:MAG: GNAT family N-acetyltransferase [Deltaproteobacteria bacterium]|nr:GNAT family N-acetyltransferase [Deltaproteobacteria bacterium]
MQNTSVQNEHEFRVILKDGSTSIFRPITTDDVDAWLEFYHNLSDRTKFLRLHHMPKQMAREDALRYCTVDYKNSFAFVAEAIEEGRKRIVAVGRYNRLPEGTTAEVAFVIEDKYQEKGIGTKFIEWLAIVARENDIDTFEAYVMQENTMMLSVFQGYGFHMKREIRDNIVHITFPLTKTPEVVKKKDERALTATYNSLVSIISPRSVAVIGASNRKGSIGQLVFQSVMQNGFSGIVYPVTPTSKAVMSVKAYHSVLDIQGEIDLAIIVVPASQVLQVADECGRKKVKGVIVISDGFRERGPDGAALEKSLRETAFGYGMRIIGPNCMGFINTDPKISLNATFALISPLHGNMAFISQSGALGLGILQFAKKLDIGFSNFMSVGNRADIASTDMLQYWEKDPATRVILLYLESFDNTDKFSRISKRVSMKKPILAIKGGTSDAGSRAAMSHTGALATSDIVSDALFHQAGIIRVNSIENLFHSARLLASQPVPRGRRVAILTNGGGPGTVAADSCSYNGLILPQLSGETNERLKSVITRDIGINNPLDLTAGISAKEFETSLKILAGDPDNDALIIIYVPPAGEGIDEIENAIRNVAPLAAEKGKPMLACFVGQTDIKGKHLSEKQSVPYYPFPEDAVIALTNAVRYGEMVREDRGIIPVFPDIDTKAGKGLAKSILTGSAERPLWVPNKEMNELLGIYGIKTPRTGQAETASEAGAIAEKIGFPVVMKLVSSTITHKSDVGGVILDIKSREEAEASFNRIRDSLDRIGRGHEMQGVMIQEMIKDGSEIIIGVKEDPSLGHVIMFGLGGIYAELLKDTSVHLHPLRDSDAREMINSVKMVEILKGYRGATPMDMQSLEELLLRISAMVEDIPQITEMDLNPVKVLPLGQGYCVVDARIMVK